MLEWRKIGLNSYTYIFGLFALIPSSFPAGGSPARILSIHSDAIDVLLLSSLPVTFSNKQQTLSRGTSSKINTIFCLIKNKQTKKKPQNIFSQRALADLSLCPAHTQQRHLQTSLECSIGNGNMRYYWQLCRMEGSGTIETWFYRVINADL